jgi:predicted  nucleic acid-binding Zn ribbon protein
MRLGVPADLRSFPLYMVDIHGKIIYNKNMYMAKMKFEIKTSLENNIVNEIIYGLLHSLRMNGQILGREHSLIKINQEYYSHILIPEYISLENTKANKYVNKYYKKINELKINYNYEIIGEESNSSPLCHCNVCKSYILYTDYLTLESLLRCGNCFGIIPLYKIPKTYDDEYYDILCWQDNYQACDNLQMNCSVGERFGIQQISKIDSQLSKKGLKIGNTIFNNTGIKTYYFLYKSKISDKKSGVKCPLCNTKLIMKNNVPNMFKYCCDNCSIIL